jgi:hypothetical protein
MFGFYNIVYNSILISILLILYERPLLMLFFLFFINLLNSCYHIAIKIPFKNKLVKFQIHFNNLARLIIYGLLIELVRSSKDTSDELSIGEI